MSTLRAGLVALAASTGCNLILGIEELETGPDDSSATTNGAGGEGGAGASGATGGGGSTTDGGSDPGGGGMGGTPCTSFCPEVEWALGGGEDAPGDDTGLAIVGTSAGVAIMGELGAPGEFLGESLVEGLFAGAIGPQGGPLGALHGPGRAPSVAIGGTMTYISANFEAGETVSAQGVETFPGAYMKRIVGGVVDITEVLRPQNGASVVSIDAIDADATGVVVVGTFRGTVRFGTSAGERTSGGTQPSVFIARLEPGDSWVQQFDASGLEATTVRAVALARPSGDIVLTGRRGGPVGFPGNSPPSMRGLYVTRLDAQASVVTADHLAVNAGFGRRLAADDEDGVMLLGNTSDDIAFTLDSGDTVSVSDTVFATRLSAENEAHFVTRLDGASETDLSVVATPRGGLAIAGSYVSSLTIGTKTMRSSNGSEIYVALLDAEGEHLWSQDYGGTFDDHGKAVALAGQRLVFTGSFSGTVAFGEHELTASGGADVFVASLDLSE